MNDLQIVAVEHGVDPRELSESNGYIECVECGGMIGCRLYERDDKPSHVCDSCLRFEKRCRSREGMPGWEEDVAVINSNYTSQSSSCSITVLHPRFRQSQMYHDAVSNGVDPIEVFLDDPAKCRECGSRIGCRVFDLEDKPRHVCDSCLGWREYIEETSPMQYVDRPILMTAEQKREWWRDNACRCHCPNGYCVC